MKKHIPLIVVSIALGTAIGWIMHGDVILADDPPTASVTSDGALQEAALARSAWERWQSRLIDYSKEMTARPSTPGRYTMFFHPTAVYQRYILDTQTGASWQWSVKDKDTATESWLWRQIPGGPGGFEFDDDVFTSETIRFLATDPPPRPNANTP